MQNLSLISHSSGGCWWHKLPFLGAGREKRRDFCECGSAAVCDRPVKEEGGQKRGRL